MSNLDAAATANETYRDRHGHEDPDYLERMLKAAWRQVEAGKAVAADVHKRWTEATRAEWEAITDAEIMASEHLRQRLASMAHRAGTETGLYNRLLRLLPKSLASLACSEDADTDPKPSLQLFLPYEPGDWQDSAPLDQVLAAQAVAIAEIARLWHCGRRLIKVYVCIPDAPPRWKLWVEYERETGRARLMERSHGSDAAQLVYGDLWDVLLSAEQTARIWKQVP
jgi:hypothetical protein